MMDFLRRWKTPIFFGVLGWLFYVASKGAYRGFFSSDDLDNLAWTRDADIWGFLTGLVTPQFYASNFRPVGHFYFWSMGRLAGWDFKPYVLVIHVLHLVNVGLLWALLGRLGFTWIARAFGVLFFAFHMAVFDAYWKPMYVFDVLCAVFCLLSVLLWIDQRRWWSLGTFWLAYKSKELAVAVPLILAAYEYWIGARQFRALAWHFAGSVWFGAQALLSAAGKSGDYGVRLTPNSLWRTVDFYASQIFRVRWAGFGVLALPALVRDPRLYWGLTAAVLWLAPMLLVPGRLFAAYLYLPLAGLAIVAAAIAERIRWQWSAGVLSLWLAFNYAEMRNLRRATLAEAENAMAYAGTVRGLAADAPGTSVFLVDGIPPGMHFWGIEGVIRYAFGHSEMRFIYQDDPNHAAPPEDVEMAMLSWDGAGRRLYTMHRDAQAGDASYIEMTRLTPLWQLTDGWYGREHNFRWTKPHAKARLRKPAGAKEFSVTVNIGPEYIRLIGQVRMRVLIDGTEIGTRVYTRNGWLTEIFPVPASEKDQNVQVDFLVDPSFQPSNGDPRALGIPIGAFGFR